MAHTTVTAIKRYFGKDTTDVDDELMTMIAGDAQTQVVLDKVPEAQQEYAERLFACHLLLMHMNAEQSSSNVKMEKVGGLETQYSTYSGGNKFDDPYQAAYSKLLENFGAAKTGTNVITLI